MCCLLAEHCRTFSWSPCHWIVFSIGPRNYRKRFFAEVVPRWCVRMWMTRALVEMMASMTAASIPVAIMLRPCFRPRRRHHVLLDKNAKIYNELDWRTSKNCAQPCETKTKPSLFCSTENLGMICSSACVGCGPSSPNLTGKKTKGAAHGST